MQGMSCGCRYGHATAGCVWEVQAVWRRVMNAWPATVNGLCYSQQEEGRERIHDPYLPDLVNYSHHNKKYLRYKKARALPTIKPINLDPWLSDLVNYSHHNKKHLRYKNPGHFQL